MKKLITRFKRAPVTAIAILLFAAIISAIICTLQASNEAELRNYEETWKSVPITVNVTASSGTISETFFMDLWVFEIFTKKEPIEFYKTLPAEDGSLTSSLILDRDEPTAELSLAEYVKNVQVKFQRKIHKINDQHFNGSPQLIGINSLSSDKQLLPEYGCEITWYEGYDESVFEGDDAVCLIPESAVEKYDAANGERFGFSKHRNCSHHYGRW